MVTRTSGVSMARSGGAPCQTTPSSSGRSGLRHCCSRAVCRACRSARHAKSWWDRTRSQASRGASALHSRLASSWSWRRGVWVCSCHPATTLGSQHESLTRFVQLCATEPIHPWVQSRHADPQIIRNLTSRKPARPCNAHRILAKLIRPACAHGSSPLPHIVLALLHKSSDGRGFPFPGQTHPTASVMGMPSAVKPFSTATRPWNSAT